MEILALLNMSILAINKGSDINYYREGLEFCDSTHFDRLKLCDPPCMYVLQNYNTLTLWTSNFSAILKIDFVIFPKMVPKIL